MTNIATSAALAVLTGIWCLGWFLTKVGLTYSAPFSFTAGRFAIGAIIMLVALRVFRGRLLPSREAWPSIALVGLLQTTLMYALSAYGLLLVDIGRATILIYATPIWAAAFGPLILGERATSRLFLSVVMGCLGIALVILPAIDHQPVLGFVILILSSLCWALAMLITKRNLKGVDQVDVVVWQTTVGAVGLVLITPVVDGGFVFTATWLSVLSLLYVAIFGTIVAMSLWFYVIQRVEMIQASLASLAVPVLVLLIDGLWFGNGIDMGLLSGSTLILASILVVFTEKRLPTEAVQASNNPQL